MFNLGTLPWLAWGLGYHRRGRLHPLGLPVQPRMSKHLPYRIPCTLPTKGCSMLTLTCALCGLSMCPAARAFTWHVSVYRRIHWGNQQSSFAKMNRAESKRLTQASYLKDTVYSAFFMLCDMYDHTYVYNLYRHNVCCAIYQLCHKLYATCTMVATVLCILRCIFTQCVHETNMYSTTCNTGWVSLESLALVLQLTLQHSESTSAVQ